MMTNLKLDIIYYKTSSDFELEFNLSGCCRMRIFKDKVETPKELVTTLARDVSRSRIILVVSDLLGEKNGVQLICSSIGYDYKTIDKAAYGIKDSDEIKAPQGSLPLVTKEGAYGGFILESGKQSIIVVSSDRALRHEVMRLYIHQYIFDINQVEAFNERMRHESEHNPIIDGSNILSTARQEFAGVADTAAAVSVAEGVAVTIASGISAPVVAPEISAPATEEMSEEASEEVVEEATAEVTDAPAEESVPTEEIPEEPVFQPKAEDDAQSEDNIIRSSSNGFVAMATDFEEEDEEAPILTKRHRRRGKGANIALLVITILLLVCFGLLAYYLIYLPIMGGELPNDLVKILKEVLPWME